MNTGRRQFTLTILPRLLASHPILVLFLLFVISQLTISVSTAVAFTSSLTAVDQTPLGSRTPLILIHGIHGREESSAYWQSFIINCFVRHGLADTYKLYKFEYDSDEKYVTEIGAVLNEKINSHEDFQDKKIVIVAHSMGGLVARSYMQEHGGHERIIKLITLATPHHGTPGENDTHKALEPFFAQFWHGPFADLQWMYHFMHTGFSGGFSGTLLSSDAPNRCDLKWDNHDEEALDFKLSQDVNQWLATLNSNKAYDSMIIAYAGYIDPTSTGRILCEADPFTCTEYITTNFIIRSKHNALLGLSAMLNAGLGYRFSWNDGMVPYVSASFAGHPNVVVRSYDDDYDHLYMKDGKESDGWKLFTDLADDLLNIVPGFSYPTATSAPSDVAFEPRGKFPTGTTFDFAVSDTEIVKKNWQTFTFRKWGYFLVTMQINYPDGTSKVIPKTIYIRSPIISVQCPNGCESLDRTFSAEDKSCGDHPSPCVTRYAWNFGNGVTETSSDNTKSYTYPETGSYDVTVTLTLDDGSTVQGSTSIFVGPGTKYINRHTIYGRETWFSGGTYVITGQIIVAQGATLTIEPGVIVKFKNQTGINVSGTLDARGTDHQKIVFTSVLDNDYGGDTDALSEHPNHPDVGDMWNNYPGCTGDGCCFEYANYWGNIHFAPTSWNSIIDHAIILWGGSQRSTVWCYNPEAIGMLSIESWSVSVTNSLISHSMGDGIKVYSSSPTLSGNTISANTYSGINLSSSSAFITGNTIINNGRSGIRAEYTSRPTVVGNAINGNADYAMAFYDKASMTGVGENTLTGSAPNMGILISSQTLEENYTLLAANSPYVAATISVPEGITLAIEPGTILKLSDQAYVHVSGTLVAKGTEEHPIVVTSIWDDDFGGNTDPNCDRTTEPGIQTYTEDGYTYTEYHMWASISFGSKSTNSTIEHAIIRYGGYHYTYDPCGNISISSSAVTLRNCEISHGCRGGISLSSSSAFITGNTIINNRDFGIWARNTSKPTIIGNTITGNNYGIYVDSDNGGKYAENMIANNSSYGFYNAGTTIIDATSNNWGDPSGPLDDSDDRMTGGLYNPEGKGNRVSNKINYDPWLGKDKIPDQFTFTDRHDAPLNTLITSNIINVSGINGPAAISVTGGAYSVNGGSYTASPGTVENGNAITVQQTSSREYATTTDVILNIGGVSDTFSVTTQADTIPDPFDLEDRTKVPPGETVISNAIKISGLGVAVPISIVGGMYAINGGAYTSAPGTVNNGDTVTVRVTAARMNSATTCAILTIGSVTETFCVRTPDTTPDQFTFSDQTGVARNKVITANSIVVTGIDTETPVSITGGTYSINGGAYTKEVHTVTYGDTVKVRQTSSNKVNTTTNATLTIGGVSDTFSVTTLRGSLPFLGPLLNN